MGRWFHNWWNGRKKTLEEELNIGSFIATLEEFAKTMTVHFEGEYSHGVIFPNSGESFSPGAVSEGFVMGIRIEYLLQMLRGERSPELRPYSTKHWKSTHTVYSGKGREKHYFDFTSTAPTNDLSPPMKTAIATREYHGTILFTREV